MNFYRIQILQSVLVFLLISCSSGSNHNEFENSANQIEPVDSSLSTHQQEEKIVEVETPKAKVERILYELGDPLNVDTLILSHMNLEEIPDLSKYTNLKYLDLSHNEIIYLNWKAFTKEEHRTYVNDRLMYLNLSDNEISEGVPLLYGYHFSQLNVLDLSNNKLSSFFIEGDSEFTTIDLSSNHLTEVQIECKYVDSILVSSNLNLSKVVMDTSSVGYLNYFINKRVNLIHSKEIPVYEPISELKDNDSLQLEYYIKRELEENAYYAEVFSLDQLKELNEIRGHWMDAWCEILYSPDSVFKIFAISGYSIGTYQVDYFKGFLHYGSEILDGDFDKIEEILKIDEGKYLILHYGGGRSHSFRSEATGQATLVSIENTEHSTHGNVTIKDIVSVSQSNLTSEDFILKYDPESKRIQYSCESDFPQLHGIDSVYRYEGSFKYKDGDFVEEYSKMEAQYYEITY